MWVLQMCLRFAIFSVGTLWFVRLCNYFINSAKMLSPEVRVSVQNAPNFILLSGRAHIRWGA